MREISPVVGLSADEFTQGNPKLQCIVGKIRKQKRDGTRVFPSASIVDCSSILTPHARRQLLDKVAALTDENYVGRSEMCAQFADLVCRALQYLGLQARGVLGTATYFDADGKRIFEWTHGWVRVGEEVIDGNVDSLFENPMVPAEVSIKPYWGPISDTPHDRQLRECGALPSDTDVDTIWWPELKDWLSQARHDAP